MKSYKNIILLAATISLGLLGACTQEQQNKISRDIQNWTGTNGVIHVVDAVLLPAN